MNSKNSVLRLAYAFLAFTAFFQTALASPSAAPNDSAVKSAAPDAVKLTQLLNEFLQGASRNDIAAHERFWADDVIYTSSLGKRRGKAEILADVRKQPESEATDEKTTFTAEDIRIQQYGTTAIVAFRLVGTTTKGDKTETSQYFNTGTFLQRDGKWQVVAWQATKIPAETEPAK
jgi:ketosteroid isomerase-like protein